MTQLFPNTIDPCSTAEKEDKWTENYTYTFDYPEVTDSGSVEIQGNSIVWSIPAKSRVDIKEAFTPSKTFQLYVNKNLVFNSTWLPIYTVKDCHKIQEMLYKCYHEYNRLVPQTDLDVKYPSKLCNSVTTVYELSNFYLYCFENAKITSIEIEYDKDYPIQSPQSLCYFQINIGNNTILSTESTFINIPYITFVLHYILNKMIETIL
jgi:hypothetical protein